MLRQRTLERSAKRLRSLLAYTAEQPCSPNSGSCSASCSAVCPEQQVSLNSTFQSAGKCSLADSKATSNLSQQRRACGFSTNQLWQAHAMPHGSQLAHLEIQRHACSSVSAASRKQHSVPGLQDDLHGPPAFVFDIDGVLVRGKHVLPAAKRALAKLYTKGGKDPLFPVCFLTNGGGVTEQHKAEQLSAWLDVNVAANQIVLSHTPFRQLAPKFADVPVLVAGRFDVPGVASSYGFNALLTTQQLAAAMPTAVPCSQATTARGIAEADRVQGDEPCPVRDHGIGSEERPIGAVLVFNDPEDWYRDLQLIIDVVVSGGVPGRWVTEPANRDVPVIFSNPDLLWANEFSAPRFGQGAFAAALDALHVQVTGRPLNKRFFGKPNQEPYNLCTSLLTEQAAALGLELGEREGQPSFGAIFAVGDNPAADVRGARNAGRPYVPILVRTGVFEHTGGGDNCSIDPADIVVNDVEAAVDAALHRMRSVKWHGMR